MRILIPVLISLSTLSAQPADPVYRPPIQSVRAAVAVIDRFYDQQPGDHATLATSLLQQAHAYALKHGRVPDLHLDIQLVFISYVQRCEAPIALLALQDINPARSSMGPATSELITINLATNAIKPISP
jgi:hypothetical protein